MNPTPKIVKNEAKMGPKSQKMRNFAKNTRNNYELVQMWKKAHNEGKRWQKWG